VAPYHRAWFHALRDFLLENGVETRLYFAHHVPTEFYQDIDYPPLFEDLDRHMLSGLFACNLPEDEALVSRHFGDLDIPVIGNRDVFPHRLSHGSRESMLAGLRMLTDAGASRLAVMGWGGFGCNEATCRRDIEHCRAALAESVELPDKWVRFDLHPNLKGAGWEEFREIWVGNRQKPDGLMVCDDMLLPDIAVALDELRIAVPDRLKVAALTNAGLTSPTRFPLAKVEIDVETHARAAGRLMLDLIAGNAPDDKVVGPEFSLVVPKEYESFKVKAAGPEMAALAMLGV
jgi:DNA-binding LacI/PurR family transcriptional regulator